MLFNSYVFLLAFLPVFLVLFFAARKASYKNPKMRGVCKWIIAACSLLFYVPFGLRNVLALAVSIAFSGAAAFLIVRVRGKGSLPKSVMAVAVCTNVAALLLFKFSGLFFPVAISFYTFNQISFLVDVYRGEVKEFTPVEYLSYIFFFPKLLQGPLMGFEKYREQLDASMSAGLSYERLLRGLLLLSMGLFKKVILADTFGKAVDYGFENVAGLGSLEAILVAVFYSFQLYFDFSGYCDMASAICMMMGFELPVNFDSPYKSVNIVDFWKRWHITLTGFFTKYVYIPLGGNRKGAARMYLNFMIVFLLSGLWHGNGWNFILWGAMHGVLFVITRMMMKKNMSLPVPKVLKVLLTFIYVTIAWVFFRAPSISDGGMLVARIFTGGRKAIATQMAAGFQLDELWYMLKVTPLMRFNFAWVSCLWIFLVFACGIIFFAPNALEVAKKCRIGVRSTIVTAFLLLWSIVSFAGVSTFLYMNF